MYLLPKVDAQRAASGVCTHLLALDPFVVVTSGTARRGSTVNGSKAAELSLLLFHAPQRSFCYDIPSHFNRSQLRPSLGSQTSSFLALSLSKHCEDRDGISLPERQFLRPGRHRLPRRFRFYHLLRGNNIVNSALRIIHPPGAMAFLATQRPVVRCHWASPLVFESSELWELPGDNLSVLTWL